MGIWHRLRLTTRILLSYLLILTVATALVLFLVARTRQLSARITGAQAAVVADVSLSTTLANQLAYAQQAIDRYLLSNRLADLATARNALESLAATLDRAAAAAETPSQQERLAALATLLEAYRASFQELSSRIPVQAGIREETVERLAQALAAVRIVHNTYQQDEAADPEVLLALSAARAHLEQAGTFNGQLLINQDRLMGERALAELRLGAEQLRAVAPQLDADASLYVDEALGEIERVTPLIEQYAGLIGEVAQRRDALLEGQGAQLQAQVDDFLHGTLNELDASTAGLVEQSAWTERLVIGSLVLAVLVTLAVGVLLARTITWPLKQLVAATTQINRGDYELTLDLRDRSELGALAESFVHMAAALRVQQREVQRQHTMLRERNGELEQTLTALQQANAARAELAGQLQVALDAAREGNNVKARFIAHMSHELRSPLNAILGFSDLMLRAAATGHAPLNAEQEERLGLISQNGEHLLMLINNVLDLSKLEAARETLKESDFDLRRLLAELEATFAMRAAQKGVALRLELAPHLPRAVRADQVKLRQVLINLLGNAVKFTERGAVTLTAEPILGGAATPAVEPVAGERIVALRFVVADTGVGITPDELPRLFEPFAQAGVGRRGHEGTGLGLPISRQLVRLLGGELEVQTAPGQGSLFAFTIPLAVLDEAPAGEAPAATSSAVALMALPARLLAGIESAALRANMREVDELIAQVNTLDGATGATLAELAAGFEYARIAALAREARATTGPP